MDITHIISLIGGLGMFLFGMKMMGESLELVAGSKLRGLLEKLTSNPLLGVLVGVVVTGAIQSSSATTVMVVGFLNAGLLKLEQAVYDFTLENLTKIIEAGVNVTMIQVGNELSNGLLWPEGKVPNYDNIAKFVNAGIRACRKVNADIPIMIHLDNGGNNELYVRWFTNFIERGEEFEYIGLSYYPFWHGTLDQLEFNMNDIAKRFNKDLIIAEVSMGFTMDSYQEYEKLADSERKGYATKPELVEKIDYPMTIEGQADFTKDFLNRVANVVDDHGKGFFWWEPAWIPVPGSGWATPASLKYMNDPGPCGNEWANQALFDYDGNVLPALDVIKCFKK